MIEYHPTFDILDSSKIQAYMQCPRKYFFEYILGWRSELPNLHLEFGEAFHQALEVLAQEGYEHEAVMHAFNKFSDHFRKEYVEIMGDDHKKKNLANAYTTLSEYVINYASDVDDFKITDTEVAGKVAISLNPTRYLTFRIDEACYGKIFEKTGHFIFEHKTGSSLNSLWYDQWLQKTQIGTYYHAARCLLPGEDFLGIVVNGIFPAAPIRKKLNGELYAGDKGPQFGRRLYHRTDAQMEAWRLTTIDWYDSIVKDTELAMKVTPDEPIMTCFRKCTESCVNYNNPCAYKDFCHAWPNPTGRVLQSGFILEYWNPEEHYIKDAKKVVTLDDI